MSLAFRIMAGVTKGYADFAPGIPHFANLPLLSLQTHVPAAVCGHLMSLPVFECLHGARRTTSVASMAIERLLRPIADQDVPLPAIA